MSIADVNSEYLGVERVLLMENAGKGIAEFIETLNQEKTIKKVKIFAGRGGNGGDGMVAVRHLSQINNVELFLLGSSSSIIKKSTIKNWKILNRLSNEIHIKELQNSEDIKELNFEPDSLIIDAIVGTGIRGQIKNPLNYLLEKLNQWQKKGNIIISVDTPTGINPDTGALSNVYLTPNWTICLHKQKLGLNQENSGTIIVKKIGITREAEELIGPGDFLALKKRDPWSKKGDNGRILVIGGNSIYSGAPSLAAQAAIQAGADLVTILCPKSISTAIRAHSFEFIVYEYPESHLNMKSIDETLIKENDVILLGPGLGRKDETREAVLKVQSLAKTFDKFIVYDADALKLLDVKNLTPNSILTPHLGEFLSLTGQKLPQSQEEFQERKEIFYRIISQYSGIWVLKGHWDIVSDTDSMKINKTGIVKMTRGGTGDILAGITSGLIVQSVSPFYAACMATYINGKASELIEKNFSLLNLLNCIPKVISHSLDFIASD